MENEDVFNYKNPVIDNAKVKPVKNCLCQRCFNSFWLEENEGDGLQCICQLMNTKTYYSIDNLYERKENLLIKGKNREEFYTKLIIDRDINIITKCQGREQDFSEEFTRYFTARNKQCACIKCKFALWYKFNDDKVFGDRELRCYCRTINSNVFSSRHCDKYVINCNAIEPATALFNEEK